MRLQLTPLLLSVLGFGLATGGAAAAQQTSSVRARSSLYQDDDATLISTSVVAVTAAASEELSVGAHGLVDVISSASVDVVSAATARWHENRWEAAGAARYHDGANGIGAGYVYSVENDWSSHAVDVGVTRDFFVHDLTLGLGGAVIANSVGRADDARFAEHLTIVSGSVSAVLVGSPKDLWALTYVLSRSTGYHASPYRYVRFRDQSSPDQVLYAPEGDSMPDRRLRHALTLRWNRALFHDTALRSHVRGYRDDWGLTSLTLGTEYVTGLHPFELALFVRGYYQRHADFYADVYPGQRAVMTADRELSTFYDVFVGPRVALVLLDMGPLSELRIESRLTGFGFRFLEFARLPRRYGYVAELGVSGDF